MVVVFGGKQPAAADMDASSAGQRAELATIREQLDGAVIPVRIEEQIPELDFKNTVRSEECAFYAAHLD